MASLNAGPEYYAAEEKYRNSKTVEDKLAALQEMLRLAPKHKSSESLLLEIKSKIAKVRKEAAIEVKKKKAAGKGQGDFIKRQGGSQIVLAGFANAGKTTLFNQLTLGKEPATHVPYETVSVTPRMWNFNKVQIQVLDTPSVTEQNVNLIFSV